MSRLRDAFKAGKAFIPFITCGDPSLAATERLVRATAEAGADIIELGIPFSDPTAEGPVIQAANVRARGRRHRQQNFRDGPPSPREDRYADGIYDLCQRGLFLWDRKLCKNCL